MSKNVNDANTQTPNVKTPPPSEVKSNIATTGIKAAAAVTGATATGGWVTVGLKDFASKIRQEFIGANLYLIGFLIVLFLGIAFYVYNYYIAPLFSPGYVANKEITKNGIDGAGKDGDDPWNLTDDDGAAFDFALLDKGLKFKNLHVGNIRNGLLLVNRDDKITLPKYTKLHTVVDNNDKESVIKVLEDLPKKEINTEINGWTPLDLALTLKQQRELKRSKMSNSEIKTNNEIKDLLINAGGEPNIALHWMAKEGDVNYMQSTINQLNSKNVPIDINLELPNNWTPLDVAMEVEVQSEGFANMKEGFTGNSAMMDLLRKLTGINNANHEKKKVNSKGSLDVKFFYTAWCPYSKKAEPEFDKLIKKYNNTGETINGYEINCVKINGESEVTKQKEFEKTYLSNSDHKKEIDAYPTIYLVKKDEGTSEVYEFEAQPRFDVFEDFIRQVAFGYAG
tara:strand:- start:768 stop:2123 length:1356 start_codon:yes stop_codon:yes gene_type:complete